MWAQNGPAKRAYRFCKIHLFVHDDVFIVKCVLVLFQLLPSAFIAIIFTVVTPVLHNAFIHSRVKFMEKKIERMFCTFHQLHIKPVLFGFLGVKWFCYKS